MGVWSVTEIMTKSRNGDTLNISVCNFEFGLLFLQFFDHFQSQVSRPNAVLKPLVGSSRKDIEADSELHKISQSLELPRIDDLHNIARQRYMSMHRVQIGGLPTIRIQVIVLPHLLLLVIIHLSFEPVLNLLHLSFSRTSLNSVTNFPNNF